LGVDFICVPIVVFVNPGSRANRRDPDRARSFANILGETGQVVSPASSAALAAEARRVAQAQPSIIGVHGGDGTLHWTVTALLRAYRERPLPPLALLPGGTMNVVAASLGIHAKPEDFLAQLVACDKAAHSPAVVVRRCLKVQDEYGFVFGTGLITNFLQEYYAAGDYGSRRAIWILLRSVLSEATAGRFAKRIFRRFQGRVFVDGQILPWTALLGLSAATVREVGLGFKLNHRADDHPGRFSVLAIHLSPLGLTWDLPAVHQGRGISPRRAWSALATRLVIEPGEPDILYTVDGDLYRALGTVSVELGPELSFVRPRSG
jgi:diacylglycerol kinase family enzyme